MRKVALLALFLLALTLASEARSPVIGHDDEDLSSDLTVSSSPLPRLSRSDQLVQLVLEEQERGISYVNPNTLERPTVQVDLRGEKRHKQRFLEAFQELSLTIQYRRSQDKLAAEEDATSSPSGPSQEEARMQDAALLLHSTAHSDAAAIDAYQILLEGADQGRAEAQYQLALLHQYRRVPHALEDTDPDAIAVEYLQAAAEQGHAGAQRELGFAYEIGKGVGKDVAKALALYTFAAKGRDTTAALVLATKYAHGLDVTRSCTRAANYYHSVGMQVIREQEKNLGEFDYNMYAHQMDLHVYHETGEDSASAEEELIQFLMEATEPSSLTQLGILSIYGVFHYPINYEEAYQFLEQAHQLDDSGATALLGFLHEHGLGVPQDNQTALQYYYHAYDMGDPHGAYFLGRAYLRGTGVTPDMTTGIKYLEEAVALRSGEAMVELGKLYLYGTAVGYNLPRALELFQEAAAFGDTRGQFYYAKMLQHGLGGPAKCDGSLEWYQQVTERGAWIFQFEEAFQAFQQEKYHTALWMYEKLALQGFLVAQLNAAWMYDHGLGFTAPAPSNTSSSQVLGPEAEWYYTLASKSKDSDYPHLRLGNSYYARAAEVAEATEATEVLLPSWESGEQLYQRAAFHYLAASHTSGEALYHLGYMHQYGLGVQRDLSLSKDFYHVSMDTDSGATIAVLLSLFSLGGDYLEHKYHTQTLDEVLPDTLDYLYPQIFTQFWTALEKDFEKGWWDDDGEEPDDAEEPDDGEEPDDSTSHDDDDDSDHGRDDEDSRSAEDTYMFKRSHAHANDEEDLDLIIMVIVAFLIGLVLLVRGGIIQVQRV